MCCRYVTMKRAFFYSRWCVTAACFYFSYLHHNLAASTVAAEYGPRQQEHTRHIDLIVCELHPRSTRMSQSKHKHKHTTNIHKQRPRMCVVYALPWRAFLGCPACICISPVSRQYLTVSLVSRISLYRFYIFPFFTAYPLYPAVSH